MNDNVETQLLTESEAAVQLCCSKALLRKWRVRDEGPTFYRIGRLVRYAPSDLSAYLNIQRVEGGQA
jgi:hypothetical protein